MLDEHLDDHSNLRYLHKLESNPLKNKILIQIKLLSLNHAKYVQIITFNFKWMANIDQVNETVFFEVIIYEHLKWKSEI